MRVEERPIVFHCEGSPLIGILHLPESPRAVGLVTVTAGGIQYRAGCGRQLVALARNLAAEGTPVLRFDHRGHGDSGGELLGFQRMDDDLARAVATFCDAVPALNHVVLYGGCEAASAIMMGAWRIPAVKSVMLANPWVDSTAARAIVTRRHYARRLGDGDFWRKLVTGGYNPLDYLPTIRLPRIGLQKTALPGLGRLSHGRFTARAGAEAGNATAGHDAPFESRMLEGFHRFTGHALLIKSGLSQFSEEFDQLVADSPDWQRACARARVQRQVFAEADQTFSTAVSRAALNRAARDWVDAMTSLPRH